METNDIPRWAVKLDVLRTTTDFSDLMKIVASYYEMYSRAVTFLGPWISRQNGKNIFFPPEKEEIKNVIGNGRNVISFQAVSAFTESLITFMLKHKGKKTLITPNPSSHHSAQFPIGTFSITKVNGEHPMLRDDKGLRKTNTPLLHQIDFANANAPVFIENLKFNPADIKFIIVRPKLGKLGTPSTSRWEVLMYKNNPGYIVDHVDSDLNPRYSGII